MLDKILNAAGPYSKALAVAVLMVAVTVADAAGVDTGLELETLWQQLGAVLVPPAVVYASPANRARRGAG